MSLFQSFWATIRWQLRWRRRMANEDGAWRKWRLNKFLPQITYSTDRYLSWQALINFSVCYLQTFSIWPFPPHHVRHVFKRKRWPAFLTVWQAYLAVLRPSASHYKHWPTWYLGTCSCSRWPVPGQSLANPSTHRPSALILYIEFWHCRASDAIRPVYFTSRAYSCVW